MSDDEIKTIRYREHRGSLAGSINTASFILNTKKALVDELVKRFYPHPVLKIDPDKVKVEYYAFDDRVPEDIWLVSMEGYGVFGSINAPLRESDMPDGYLNERTKDVCKKEEG